MFTVGNLLSEIHPSRNKWADRLVGIFFGRISVNEALHSSTLWLRLAGTALVFPEFLLPPIQRVHDKPMYRFIWVKYNSCTDTVTSVTRPWLGPREFMPIAFVGRELRFLYDLSRPSKKRKCQIAIRSTLGYTPSGIWRTMHHRQPRMSARCCSLRIRCNNPFLAAAERKSVQSIQL